MAISDERFNKSFSISGLRELQLWRHIIQLLAFVALNGKIFGIASTVLIVPYLHSTQSPFSTANGAYDVLEYSISRGIFPLLALGVIYLTAVTVGRVFCGWACPLGMVQDFLSYLPVKKERISTSTANSMRDIKWAVVAFSILTSIVVAFRRRANPEEFSFGVFTDAPFAVISPSATLFTYVPWMVIWKSNVLSTLGFLGWLKMAILLGVLAPSVYIPRFFCRFLCPMGALLEPFSKYKALRIYRSGKLVKEDLNKLLADVCPMGVQASSEESDFIDHPGCIHCGKCITELPKMLEQKISVN